MQTAMMRSPTVLVAVLYRYDALSRCGPRRSPTVPVAVLYRYDTLARCGPRRSPTVPVAVFYRYDALPLTPGRQDMSITPTYYAVFINRAIREIVYQHKKQIHINRVLSSPSTHVRLTIGDLEVF